MRLRNYPFRLHIYNFKFIFDYYGSQGVFFLKKWIDINYRIIRTNSKLRFLKQCKTNNVYPQHITHISKISLNIFHYKAIRKFEGLISKINSELLRIEIFDSYKYLHSLNNELSSLSNILNRLFPNFIWDSIKKHHFCSFNNYKHRLNLSHNKKFLGLITKNNKEFMEKITKINYSFLSTHKKYLWKKSYPADDIHENPNEINITIDPHNFGNKSINALEHTNKKWFLNLTDTTIPQEVSSLLQLGERFCLPSHLNKKSAIHEFIKDIESNSALHKSKNQTLIRNIVIPQFYKNF